MTTTQVDSKAEIKALKAELAQTKEQLKDLKMVFNTILESTLAGYWDWYIQEDYEYMSPTFKQMFGYQDHEMPNHPDEWQKIIHPKDLPQVFDIFNKHVETKGKFPFDNEVRYFHKDGSIIWVYCRGEVVEWDEKGDPVRMIGCHIDITRLKKAEHDLKQKTLGLIQKNKELEQFAYVASHDLQEPLNTVTNFVRLFEDSYKEQLDQEGRLYFKYITQASRRMKELITALLDYSRIGRQRELSVEDSTKIVYAIIDDMNKTIKETNTIITFDHLPILKVYPIEFRLLLQNLISNAIKFSKKNESPKIHITASETETAWEFEVKDNGIGFSEEYHKKIFIIFQRLHAKHKYEGSGIGLAHCKKIIELHGGKIWAKSVLGKGSSFYFTIPKL